MLIQSHTAADLAADHRRALLAEADAHRLAQLARAARREEAATRAAPRRGWLRLLTPTGRRATA